jgi:hypothetical protein
MQEGIDMDHKRFDRWARLLGDRATRRGLLGGVAGLAAIPLGEAASRAHRGRADRRSAGSGDVATEQNAECAARCKELFPPGKKRGRCISQGVRGRGPCAEPVCEEQCAKDAACCDEPGFGCCDGACVRLGHDGECPPPVCVPPSSCTADDQCCGTDRCSCGAPNVCVQFKSLGTCACCKSDDDCIQQCVKSAGEPLGRCCDPAFPDACLCEAT